MEPLNLYRRQRKRGLSRFWAPSLAWMENLCCFMPNRLPGITIFASCSPVMPRAWQTVGLTTEGLPRNNAVPLHPGDLAGLTSGLIAVGADPRLADLFPNSFLPDGNGTRD